MLIFATSLGLYAVLAMFELLWAIIGVGMARSRGRNMTAWGIGCFLFGVFGVIALAIAGKTDEKKREEVQRYVASFAQAPGVAVSEWRPDPTGRHEYRYWDGSGWSDNVADQGRQAVDPIAPAPAQPQKPQVDASTKRCPECAEEVKAAAVVCRFCGHRFEAAAGKQLVPVQ